MTKFSTSNIPEKQISRVCAESAQLFRRVFKHTEKEHHAWIVVQELLRRYPPKSKVEHETHPIYVGQLADLHGLGIHRLEDLTWKQAFQLIDFVREQRQGNEPY